MATTLSSRRATHLLRTVLLLAASAFVASACGDDSTEPEDEVTIVGTWNVTSFQIAGMNPIAQGMEITVNLTGSATSGTYEINIRNDVIEICDDGASGCDQPGNYVATATQITLDPNDEEPTVFNFTISGSQMTWVGTIDGIPVTMTAERA